MQVVVLKSTSDVAGDFPIYLGGIISFLLVKVWRERSYWVEVASLATRAFLVDVSLPQDVMCDL